MTSLPSFLSAAQARERIRSWVIETPLVSAPDLQNAVGQPLWLKCEHMQRTGSFKARGAMNWLLTASREELAPGLVTVSAGNHAIALAWAARQQNVSVTVIMPDGSSPSKIARTRALGAEVIVGGTIGEAVAHCHELQRTTGRTLAHPYNDARVIAGQATTGLELLGQAPWLTRVLCPVGGGGLLSGLGITLKHTYPHLELIGVEPEGAATMTNAWQHASSEASLASVNTWASSLAPAIVGDLTYALSRQWVDKLVTVSEEAIANATRLLMTDGHQFVEPGAAVGLAALMEGRVAVDANKPTALILTGSNMDLEQISRCLPATDLAKG